MNYSQGCRGNKNSHGISHVNGNGNHIYPMGILIVNPVGNPVGNIMGMGWECELKFYSHGNPVRIRLD